MKKEFDAIVIVTGQSAPFRAARLAAAEQRVAIIERQGFGGTCVNTGCILPKTLGGRNGTLYPSSASS
jgi:pyruvate/2-oxoglutarate dehydrogenase complex dihydrolipoamide dehydrogenase (E3) component